MEKQGCGAGEVEAKGLKGGRGREGRRKRDLNSWRS